MKKYLIVSKLIFGSILLIIISGCKKFPVASFTTDKEVYYVGETVHLKNISSNEYSYTWIMPDGQISSPELSTPSFDYIIRKGSAAQPLTFRLEAKSRYGKKVSTATKTVTVKPFPLSTFTIDGIPANIENILLSTGGNNVRLDVSYFYFDTCRNKNVLRYVSIGLGDTIIPTSLVTYPIQHNYYDIIPDSVSLSITGDGCNPGYEFINYNALSGQVSVSQTDGIVHFVYNNVPANHYLVYSINPPPNVNYPNVVLSGDFSVFLFEYRHH